MTRDCTITYLAGARDRIPELAKLFVEEWTPYYGPEGPGDATADLLECCNTDTVPLALVAMDKNSTVLGTAALKTESVGDDICEGPWLAALAVSPDHRNSGCGTALVAAIELHARRFGFSGIACSTETAEGILQKRGWHRVRQSESLRGCVPVYRLEFDAN